MHRISSYTVWFACLIALGGLAVPAFAQVSTIYGSVSDPGGAKIPGATITVLNLGTGTKKVITTDPNGNYIATPLPIGNYTVQADATGFQRAEVAHIVLEIMARREVDFVMKVGAVATAITVSGVAPLLEPTTSSLGQVINAQSVAELPLNGRDFTQLGTLTSGVVAGTASLFNSPQSSSASRGVVSFAVDGMRENDNDWRLDGIDNNELLNGSVSVLPNIDAIEEFKVLTNDYSAEYGRSGGGTVVVTTKAGTNQLHGTLFEYLRNDAVDARNYFSAVRLPYRQNQFGGSTGGPIKKDKLFFFGAYQGTQIRKGYTFISTVPTSAMHNGDFSAPGINPIYDPKSGGNRTQFTNNMIPQSRIDPAAQTLINLYPLPNLPGLANNYTYAGMRQFSDEQYDIRIDHNISTKDSYFGRFVYENAYDVEPGPWPGPYGGFSSDYSSGTYNHTRARNAAWAETHLFSPTIVNLFELGFNRVSIFLTGDTYGTNVSEQLGIPGINLNQFSSGLTHIDISGYNGLGDRLSTPLLLVTNVPQLNDNLSVVHGAHQITIGFEGYANEMNAETAPYPRGAWSYNSLYTEELSSGTSFVNGTGNPVASFLLGLPYSAERSYFFGGAITGRRWKVFRPFIQDDYKVSSKLAMNLGFGWGMTTPYTEALNRFANFDPKTGTMLVAGVNGVSSSAGVNMDWTDLEPRFGFAYTPLASRKFVIRGGYGIVGDYTNGGSEGLELNPPFYSEYDYASNSIAPGLSLSEGFPAPVSENPNNPTGNLYYQNYNFKIGRVEQWNFTLQQELPGNLVATEAYVGNDADHLLSKDATYNVPPPGPGQIINPYPNIGVITVRFDRGSSDYNGLQTRLEREFRGNFYLLADYTWSKGFTNGLVDSVGTAAPGTNYWPFAPWPHSDKGLSSDDLTQSFDASYLWQLPIGKGHRFLGGTSGVADKFVGGWQYSGIVRVRSGFPFGLTISPSLLNNTMSNRPNHICTGTLSKPTAKEWFNTSCFVQPAPYAFGNSARTNLFGPSQVNFDMTLHKDIPLTERLHLQFRAEFFNAFNTTQLSEPNTTIGTGSAGTITSTVNDQREIQFALRLSF